MLTCRYPVEIIPKGTLTPIWVACGRCHNCRVARKNTWATRIELEAREHLANCFATATYDDKHVPESGNLVPEDPQLWIKRLRKRVAPTPIRVSYIGEYGDQTWRPHYHAIFYGIGCHHGPVITAPNGTVQCECPTCRAIRESWHHGFVTVHDLTPQRAAYIAHYNVKKLTNNKDPWVQNILKGRTPEFAHHSNRPGIGYGFAVRIAHTVTKYSTNKAIDDVPNTVNIGRSTRPIAPYLRRKARLLLGRPEQAPQSSVQRTQDEIRIVLEYAKQEARRRGSIAFAPLIVKERFFEGNEGRERLSKARTQLRRKASI